MIKQKKVVVVMPAYNAEQTLEKTWSEIPLDMVDEVVLVDDASRDETSHLARQLGIHHVLRHDRNRGYGGNQKTCYAKALELGADIIIMVHPDYQYSPKLIESMAYIIANDVYPVVYASRILGKGALKGGMPMYKYVANRLLTLFQNIMMGQKLSEYHTGYRAFSGEALKKVDLEANSDDFVFDNQITAQIFMAGMEIAEVTCPTRYFKEASSINFRRSVIYGLGVLKVCLQYRLHKWGMRSAYLNGRG
ncbi:MAG: glycosyltransferase family 2 protein [Bacteroidota bacterium]